jgi:putative membrane protein
MWMHKPIIIAGLSCCALFCVAAFGQAGAAAGSDQSFVDFAAQTDMLEAHLGQMAQDQAAKQDVKTYAQMLNTDHTSDYNALTTAATKAGDSVPKGIDAAGNKVIARFEKLKGASFDRTFLREMVAGHTKAIARYKEEIDKGQNADVKAYAQQALPTLEKHLNDAKDLLAGKPMPTS